MRASFKKRLKWYGGIFFIASLVFGVNMFQYDKVKFRYVIEKSLICDEQRFLQKVWKKNNYTSMADQIKSKKNVNLSEDRLPITTGRFSKIAKMQEEAKKAYQACLAEKQKGAQEAQFKKERTEVRLGIGGRLMALTASLALIDFIVFLFRNRRLKIKTGEAMPMENKKITKIAILSFIVWGIMSFLIAQSGYRHKFHVDTFLMLNIPSLLIVGYLWIADKFTLK